MKMNKEQKDAVIEFLDSSSQTRDGLERLLSQFDGKLVLAIASRVVGKMKEIGLVSTHERFATRHFHLLRELCLAAQAYEAAEAGPEAVGLLTRSCARIINKASYYYLTHDPEHDVLDEILKHYDEDRGSIRLVYTGQNFFDIMGVS